MDGLLVDSERLERRAWRAAAREHGIELTDMQFASFVGHSDECERLLIGYYGPDFPVRDFRASCRRHLHTLMESDGVPLRPGAREWIEFVAGLGIPLGLATSSGPAHVRERLGNLISAFHAIATRADVSRSKPQPDLYLEAAARLRVRPELALAVEDSPAGARAALAAGMPVIVVPDLVVTPPDVRAMVAGVFESLHAVREAAARAWCGARKAVR